MKQLSISLLFVFLFTACADTSENTMVVTGAVKGLKKGVLYLQKVSDTTLISIDSLEVQGDGNFKFTTSMDSPQIFYLYLKKEDNNEMNDRITFFGEPGSITIQTSWNEFEKKAVIEGSVTQKKLEEYLKVMSRFNTQNLGQVQASNDPDLINDPQALDSLQKAYAKNIRRSYLYALNFALSNTESHIAPYIALTEVADANIKYLDSIYNSLAPEVANGTYGVALKKHLNKVREN
jgi:signal recognition particle receptor subunit beta